MVSESCYLNTRSGLCAYLTCCPKLCPFYARASVPPLEEGLGWNDELQEGLVYPWIGLDKRGKDLGMLPEIMQESVTAPATHDLHCLYWYAMKQVEKGGTNAYTMTLKGVQTCLMSGRGQTLDESRLGEGVELILVPICKKVGVPSSA